MSSHETFSLQEVTAQLQAASKVPGELLDVFSEEAEDHLRTIYDGLNRQRQSDDDASALADVRRAAHTLKGAAGAVGLEAVTRLAHRMEDLLDRLNEYRQAASAEQLKLMLTTTDQIQELTTVEFDMDSVAGQIVTIYEHYSRELTAFDRRFSRPPDSPTSAIASPSVPSAPPIISGTLAPAGTAGNRISAERRTGQYLRVPLHRLDDLVGLVGEMIVNRSTMEKRLDLFESRIDEIDAALKRLRKASRDLGQPHDPPTAWSQIIRSPQCPRATATLPGISRMPARNLDALEFDQYSHLQLLVRSLDEGNSDVEIVAHELRNLKTDFDSLFQRLDRLNRETQNRLMQIRMVPVSGIVSRLERTVRSVSARLKLQVELEVSGARTVMDKTVLDEITDPLLHLIRNAIDHGVESPAVRKQAGKPEQARIHLQAINQGTQVTIRISDDGGGINLRKVRQKAIQNGLIRKQDKLSTDELHNLVFLPGFSTAEKLTDVSGRGVGMDVVRDAVARLNGTIRVESCEGQGTTFTIQLPTSVGISRALLVKSAGQRYALPMQSVQAIQRLDPGAVRQVDGQAMVAIQDESLKIMDLATHLQLSVDPSGHPFQKARPLLVIRVADDSVALVVDAVEGGQDIAVKSLGDHLRKVPGLVGATVCGDGSIIPILDPVDLAGRSAPVPAPSVAVNLAPARTRVSTAMVVDDSISVRRVTTKLLQLAGWDVVAARDGVEALEKLDELETAPDVFLCDMEMPRMDGIELISQIRKQTEFEFTPIVMVTSRASEKHRNMAMEAGANEYVVKPYNDEHLLELVNELVQTARETIIA